MAQNVLHTDPSAINVRTIVAALQAIEQQVAAAPTAGQASTIAEMSFTDLLAALKDIGINIVNAGPTPGALRRRQAIEEAIMKLNSESAKRPLTTTPVDMADATDTYSDLALADLSDFSPSDSDDSIMVDVGATATATTTAAVAAPTTTTAAVAATTTTTAAVVATDPAAVATTTTTDIAVGTDNAIGDTDNAIGDTDNASGEIPPPGTGHGVFSSGGILKGYVCHSCKAYNTIVSGAESWYAVTKGRQIGVYKGWAVVSPMVVGISCATYVKKDTKEEAEEVFDAALHAGSVEMRPY